MKNWMYENKINTSNEENQFSKWINAYQYRDSFTCVSRIISDKILKAREADEISKVLNNIE